MNNIENSPLTWGRICYGKTPRKPALPVALIGGTLAATSLSLLATFISPRYDLWWQSLAIYLVMLLPVSVAGVWALVIDRATLVGAVRNPEESVENSWAKNAAFNAFAATVILTSIGLTVAVLAEYRTIAHTLLIVLLGQMLTFVISYQVEARKK